MYATATIVRQTHLPSSQYMHNAIVSNPLPAQPRQHHPTPVQPSPQQPPASSRPPAAVPAPQDTVTVTGVPSVSIQDNRLCVGDSDSTSRRSYTPLKVLGDGSFGTVWLCDWHGTLPPNTPLSPMQCGAGARPEWAGKRLVAVKRMKKKWEGGWDECKKLKELESLRAIPFHPNIIPLYDFFLLPNTKELYFVFESMEGNLYHLIKARKGRSLAGGLVASIFRQMCTGLAHIHKHGYFHRDMKPENVLVTTIGLHDYQSISPLAVPGGPPEKDVVAIIKLADFGLARETNSKPPYTEYVSTRWYRAPEVLLLSKDYSNPVDMWAVGTIMAELVNLRPLFPGSTQIDQVARICQILGDPCADYGKNERGAPVGGGQWLRGIQMAKDVGFAFPKIQPKDFADLFESTTPPLLIDCILDLLRYDPASRLTSQQCLEHAYLVEMLPRNNIPMLNAISVQVAPVRPALTIATGIASHTASLPAPRLMPTSQAHAAIKSSHQPAPPTFPDASSSHRSPFLPAKLPKMPHINGNGAAEYMNGLRIHDDPIQLAERDQQAESSSSSSWGQRTWDSPNVPPRTDMAQRYGEPMDLSSPIINSSPMVNEFPARPAHEPELPLSRPQIESNPNAQTGKLGKLSLGFAKKSSKWGLSMFGGQDKIVPPLPLVGELELASTSTPSLKRTQSGSTDSRSLPEFSQPPDIPLDPKAQKKEAERLKREADLQRRQLAIERQRDQARAVMQKRNEIGKQVVDFQWRGAEQARAHKTELQTVRNRVGTNISPRQQPSTISAAAGRYGPSTISIARPEWHHEERYAKARRRHFDDDHSMSSSQSIGRISVMSFATVDTTNSDPGSSLMLRPDTYGASTRSTTTSSNASADNYSRRSSHSLSAENQLINEFSRAHVDGVHLTRLQAHPTYISMPPAGLHPPDPDFLHDTSPERRYSPSLARTTMNPIFKVPPLPSPNGELKFSLPPCSQLQSVAEGEYPPLSPMSFTAPEDAEADFR